MHPWNSCELCWLYGRTLYGLYVDYTDYSLIIRIICIILLEKNWAIFHIIRITWVHKLYGLYIDYTDYTMHIIVIINISSIIKITCLYLQSCLSTRRSANTTHKMLLYKILQDHMMVEYKILLCHHLQAVNVLTQWCTCTYALLPFQALSPTVTIALWMAVRCDMWTLGHWDGLMICNEGLWHVWGNF